jgi:hypothetical protein
MSRGKWLQGDRYDKNGSQASSSFLVEFMDWSILSTFRWANGMSPVQLSFLFLSDFVAHLRDFVVHLWKGERREGKNQLAGDAPKLGTP